MITKRLAYCTTEEKSLIERAVSVRERGYAPYSNFKVGSALLVHPFAIPKYKETDYDPFLGCNVEVSSYIITHAEQSAIAHMIRTLGCTPKAPTIKMIAVALGTEKDDEHALPCGNCRQWIREFGNDDTIIIGAKINKHGIIWQVELTTLGELLPNSFRPANLGK